MIKWIAIPAKAKKNADEQVSEVMEMSDFSVEKDWWVVQSLSTVFCF